MNPSLREQVRRSDGLNVSSIARAMADVSLRIALHFDGLVERALCDLGVEAARRDIVSTAVRLGRFTRDQLALPSPPSKLRTYPNELSTGCRGQSRISIGPK